MNSWLFVSLNNENIKEEECSMKELISDTTENITYQEEIDQKEEKEEKEEKEKKEEKEIVVNINAKEETKNIERFKNKFLDQKKIFSIYASNVENIVYEQIINMGLCYDYLSFENKICMIGIFAVFCTSLM